MSDEASLHWMEVRLLVPESDLLELEALEQEILAVTPGGFATEAWDAPPLPGEREPVPVGWTRYLVYVGEHVLEAARLALSQAVARWPSATVVASPLDDGWRERWKQYFKPLRASARFIVAPPWEPVETTGDERLLVIEPAMAFGTAQHETTALCLDAVDRIYAAASARGEAGPDSVCDVGTGTGILAIAAAMLGAKRAFGNDIDPTAVLAAKDNLRLNPSVQGVGIVFDGTPIGEVTDTFALVIANILTPTLIMLSAAIASRVAPGGLLMLSGILAEQEGEIRQAFEPHGLVHRGTAEKNGWIRVDFARA